MPKRANGEGSVFYQESRKEWVCQFTIGRNENGKLKRKATYGKTRKEALAKRDEILLQVKGNTYHEKSDTILMDILDNYITNQFKSNQIIAVTYKRKTETKKIISKMPIAQMKIQDISIDNINASLQTITNYSGSVINKICGLISIAFDIAILNNLIASNPFNVKGAIIKPKSLKKTREIDALTSEEEIAFLQQLKTYYEPYKTILYIADMTGMRIGEILALHKDNISNDTIKVVNTITRNSNDKVILGKTTKTYSGMREIPIMNNLKKILNNYPFTYESGYLFIMNNNFISPSIINQHFKRICKNANIRVVVTQDSHLKKNGEHKSLKSSKVNTHMLRHTFASRCIERGMNAVVLSRILGHKNISITLNTYTTIFNKIKNDELKKMNKFYNI